MIVYILNEIAQLITNNNPQMCDAHYVQYVSACTSALRENGFIIYYRVTRLLLSVLPMVSNASCVTKGQSIPSYVSGLLINFSNIGCITTHSGQLFTTKLICTIQIRLILETVSQLIHKGR